MGEVGSVTDQVCSNHLKSLKGRAKNDSCPVPESQSFIFDVSTYEDDDDDDDNDYDDDDNDYDDDNDNDDGGGDCNIC